MYRVDSWLDRPSWNNSPVVQAGRSLDRPWLLDGATLSSIFAIEDTNLQRPSEGSALIIRNRSFLICAGWADWVAFRPDIAQACGWVPDIDKLAWVTADGEIAVVMIPWTDGHLYQRAHFYEETVARGRHVLATDRGMEDLESLGGVYRRHRLERTVEVDDVEQQSDRSADLPKI